jgi:hypothetical protein
LERVDNNEFVYSIGGIALYLTSDFPISANDTFLYEGLYCFCPVTCKSSSVSDEEAFYINITSCSRKYSVLDKIFSLQRTNLYTTAEGYLQRFYLTDDKKDLLWTVAIEHSFTRFEYCLHPHNGREKLAVTDPYGPITSLFLLQHSFINRQGLIIHAAGGTVQGKGIAFAAPSGTGKSTLSELLVQSPHNRFFSEERLIVRLVDKQWHVWGTPWHGEGNIARNESAPLSALVFLKQSQITKITPLSSSEGLHRLIQTASISWYSEEWTDKGLALCESLIKEIPMFELAFRPDQSAVQAVEHLAAAL